MPRPAFARLAAGAVSIVLVAACGGGVPPSPNAQSPAAQSPAATAPAASSSAAASSPTSPSSSAAASPGAPSIAASAAASPSGSAAPEADVTVVGVDYAFEQMPPTVTAGTTLGFRNDGREVHEMAVFRINDDTTLSLEQLLALPGEQALEFVTETGTVFAGPGQAATDVVTVSQPGNYAMLCFVPVGMTELPSGDPNASPGASPDVPSGPPHFVRGMVLSFTVGQ